MMFHFRISDFGFYLLNVDEVGKSVQAYQEALSVSPYFVLTSFRSPTYKCTPVELNFDHII